MPSFPRAVLATLVGLSLAGCIAAPLQETPLQEAPLYETTAQAVDTELVVNGGFESSTPTGWTLGGAKAPIRSTAHPHLGGAGLRFGATTTTEPNGDSWATQNIAIPAGIAGATLSFWYYPSTADTLANDWQDAQLRTSSGQLLVSLFHLASNTKVWTQRTVDVTAYAGTTLQLYFNVHSNGGTTPTSLWIDDVSLVARTSGGGGGGGTGTGAQVSVHTTLGLPDSATTSTSNPNHYLSVKPQYVISYNGGKKVPNWTSWELNTSYLKTADRQDTFRVDASIPAAVTQAALADYAGSGWDRGHLCPSADRTLTTTDNSATFYLTNMIPQSPHNNRGPWARLEDYGRDLAVSGKELFIIAGPVFDIAGTTIGNGVAVPVETYKVIVVLNAPGQGVANVTASTRVIAVMMPNDDDKISQSDDWHGYRTTVRAIESATGLDFLSDVPQAVQDVIETRVDTVP